MSLLEGHGNAVMNRLGRGSRRRPGAHGPRPPGPAQRARRDGHGPTAARTRAEDEAVRGRRGVRQRDRARGRAARDRLPRGGARSSSRRSTSSPTRCAGSPGSTARRSPPGRSHRAGAAGVDGVDLDGLVAPVVVGVLGWSRLARAADPRRRSAARPGRGARRPRAASRERARCATSCGTRRAGSACGRALRPRRRRSWRQPRGPGPRGAVRRARVGARRARGDGGARRAHRRRPGRDGAAEPAARQRGSRARRHAGRGAGTSCARCSGRAARTCTRCASSVASRRWWTRRTTIAVHRRNWVRLDALPGALAPARAATSCPC